MKPDVPIKIPGLAVALNSGQPRHRINIRESPVLQNFTLEDGVAQKRTGYDVEGNDFGGGLFSKGHYNQEGLGGTSRFFGFGSTHVKEKSTQDGSWTDQTNSQSLLDEGSSVFDDLFWTTCESVELSDYRNYLLSCQADTKRIGGLFNTVFYNDPASSFDLTQLAGGNGYNADDTVHRAKAIVSFADRPILIHTKEEYSAGNYTEWFQRIRWSRAGYFLTNLNWDVSRLEGAGYWDFVGEHGPVLNACPLGQTLHVFQQEAISSGYRTNVTAHPFYFEPKLEDFGLYSWRAFAKGGGSIFLVANDNNIYRYWGGKDYQNIGKKIRKEFFDNINAAAAATAGYLVRDRMFAFTLPYDEAVAFVIPIGPDDDPVAYPSMAYMYFWNEDRWEYWSLADAITGCGLFELEAGEMLQKMPVLGAASGKLYHFNYSDKQDRVGNTPVNIDAQIQTMDFILDLKEDVSGANIYFESSGDGAASSVDVSVSTDAGASFGTPVTVNWTDTGWKNRKVHLDFSAYVFRLKFRNNSNQKLLLGDIQIELNIAGEDL